MKILQIDLRSINDDSVDLRYLSGDINQGFSLPLAEILDLISEAERDYYVEYLPVDYGQTGQRLYQWLDRDRTLSQWLDVNRRDGVILAIASSERLAHLPWEILHDGEAFLVEQQPGIIPMRWVPRQMTSRVELIEQPQNRALNLAFMACSPDNVSPVLDFEKEEGVILDATERQRMSLEVEESGCLSELRFLLDSYSKNHFDVVHLTGHGEIRDDVPVFLTESEFGEVRYSPASEIAKTLQFKQPHLLFLSGCRTGQGAQSGAVPSMAEQLVQSGSEAVLSWGQPVSDREASAAAAALYQGLATGCSVAESLAKTYQALIENQAQDWHLLRCYVADRIPASLVTAPRTPGRKRAPQPSQAQKFLDPRTQKVKVPKRQGFVGRRRHLQSCLRALRTEPDQIGVLIYGMGGLGKSSLASRLADRLSGFQPLVWVGELNEDRITGQLAELLDQSELRQVLQGSDQALKFRLRQVLETAQFKKPLLLILDDFEHCLEPLGNGYQLKTEASKVLEALIWAIKTSDGPHRIVITSRYDFAAGCRADFYGQELDSLKGADLRKKCDRLSAFAPQSKVDQAWVEKAQRLADGNPRLLEWLNQLISNATVNIQEVLARLDALSQDQSELREQVLAQALIDQMQSSTLKKLLSSGKIFELPVPREVFMAMSQDSSRSSDDLDRAIALGLVEVSPNQTLRVPRILPLPEPDNITEIINATLPLLYQHWWEDSNSPSEEHCLELIRLAQISHDAKIAFKLTETVTGRWINVSRFKEGVNLCQKTLELGQEVGVIHQLARCEKNLGDTQQALVHYKLAQQLCQKDDSEKASIIHNLAGIYANQGQVDDAIALYKQSIDIDEKIGDVQGKAATLHQLAGIYANQGQVEDAIALYKQSLEIQEKIGNIQGKAATLHQLAGIYANQGQVEDAIALYKQSLEIQENIGNIQGKAATLHQLAGIYANQGQVEDAIALYKQSIDIEEKIGNIKGKAATLHQLAGIYVNQGQVEDAIALYKQSLEIKEKIGDVQGKAATLHQLAGIYADQGQVEDAIALYKQVLDIDEKIGDVQGKAATLHQLAGIYVNQGQVEDAIALYKQSLEIKENIGNIKGKAITVAMMAQLKVQLGHIDEAILDFNNSIATLRKLKSPIAQQVQDILNQVLTINR